MAFSSNDPRNYLALGRQTNADTAATSFKFLKFLGDSGFDITQDIQSVFEGGDGQEQGLHYRQHDKADGSLVAYVRPDTWTYLSAWAMGSAAVVGTSAGVGTSVFVANATVPALTIEQAFAGGNQIERTHAAYLTGFQVEGAAGDPWKVTVPFMSAGTPVWRDGAASALTPVLESGDPAMYAGGAYLIVPSSNANLATSIDIRQFSVNFSRQVDDSLYTTTTFRRKLPMLSRMVDVTFQVIFQDSYLYRQILFGDPAGTTLPVTLATGGFHAERQLISSQLMAIDVPNLRYTAVSLNKLVPDGQTVIVDVTAKGVRAGTSILQLRSVHNNVGASAYLG